MRSTAGLLDEVLRDVLGAAEDEAADVIDLGASRLTARAEDSGGTSRAVVALYVRVADGCWRRGWEPADMVRFAGRTLGPAYVPVATDVVAADARTRRAPNPRWAAQVRALDATTWWEDDEGYLTALGARDRLDRFGTAGRVLELLRLLGRLPAIAPLGSRPGPPPPSSARARADTRMLTRIRALLAKAESTEYDSEADALTAKAQELMARHRISEALVAAEEPGRDEPSACRIGIDNPYESAKALLLDAVATANGCQTIWSSALGFSTVVGFDSDLDAVELLYTSLLVQATTAMNRAGSRRHGSGRSRTRSFRQSFLIAYAGRIRERLTEATREAVAGTGDERLLPVLAAREVAVKDSTERMFPGRTTHRLRGGRDADGWAHGTAAADRAELGTRERIPEGGRRTGR